MDHKPLAIDLFCGLGGWTKGLLAEGYDVVGFDNKQHIYSEDRYPTQLVLQDVLTIHGAQFKNAALIVASPPCQEFSYMAMPWTKAKEKIQALRDGRDDPKRLTALFDACFRIQREAIAAAGHFIPLVVENVCGAQKWVGRSRHHFGSFYLWGDVPALMPIAKRAKIGGFRNDHASRNLSEGVKAGGGSWFNVAHNTTSGVGQNSIHRRISESWRNKDYENTAKMRLSQEANTLANAADGRKQKGSGVEWWRGEIGSKSSKSSERQAASARIAMIPFELARHIAASWKP